MKKINCNVIKDLLPLYVDQAVSEDTRELVEEHLFTCESCREEAETLKKTVILPVHPNLRAMDKTFVKQWKEKWLKKKIIIAAVSVLVTLGAGVGIYSGLMIPRLYIPYDETLFSLEMEGGKLYANYTGADFDGTVSFHPVTVKEDGEEKRIVCFYYYDSPWTRYVKPRFPEGKNQEEGRLFLGETADIDEVYYGEFDKDRRHQGPDYENLGKDLKDWDMIYG